MNSHFKIEPVFECDAALIEVLHKILGVFLPPDFFSHERAKTIFYNSLPLISWSSLKDPPFSLTFFFCSKYRAGLFHFFHEMICRSLLTSKRPCPLIQYAIDFKIPLFEGELFTAGQLTLQIESEKELNQVISNLHLLETQLRLGLELPAQANRILEMMGVEQTEKIRILHESITRLIKAFPHIFDFDLFSQMQHFLVLSKDEFLETRSSRVLLKIIVAHYLFRKASKHTLEAFPDRRYVSCKLTRVKVLGKTVLGVTVGLSFLRANEVFEEKHLLDALNAIISGLQSVEGTFFSAQHKREPALTLYLEVEKENDDIITLEEMAKLKIELPNKIVGRIEERLNPLFMPENEEEILRHIVTLGGQVKYVKDLPQTVINFHKQTQEDLKFSVVIVRVVAPYFRSIQETFDKRKTSLKLVHNRTKIIGSLRKKYDKEASVFRVALSKLPFVRQDHSIDLYKARGQVSHELSKILGDFRDYNGGIISKETQTFSTLRLHFEDNHFLLENFFYSLSPAVMRSLLAPEPLKTLFGLLVEAENILEPVSPHYLIHEDEEYFYLVMITNESTMRGQLESALSKIGLKSTTFFVKTEKNVYFGLLYKSEDHSKSIAIQTALEDALNVGK